MLLEGRKWLMQLPECLLDFWIQKWMLIPVHTTARRLRDNMAGPAQQHDFASVCLIV